MSLIVPNTFAQFQNTSHRK